MINIGGSDETLRIGGCFPTTMDVTMLRAFDTHGVMATVFTHKSGDDQGYSQLRKRDAHPQIGLFVFAYDDAEVPEHWKDSVVIWDSRTSYQKSKETPDE